MGLTQRYDTSGGKEKGVDDSLKKKTYAYPNAQKMRKTKELRGNTQQQLTQMKIRVRDTLLD